MINVRSLSFTKPPIGLAVLLTLLVLTALQVVLKPAAIASVKQNLPEVMVKGYAGGEVSWSEFSFKCGNHKISFESWSQKVELPGECPKDVDGIADALKKLLKEAGKLKLQNTSMFKELGVWISFLTETIRWIR
jgi:hypothetical protein